MSPSAAQNRAVSPSAAQDRAAIAGVVLAGGRSARMGGRDKALLPLAGRPLIAHVLARAAPQVAALLINANGDGTRLGGFGHPVALDVVAGHAGPLAGILTAMIWAGHAVPAARFVASVPTDTPFLPTDLVARLAGALIAGQADIALAASRGRTHPVCGLWPLALAGDLDRAVRKDGVRKIEAWTARFCVAVVPFATAAGAADAETGDDDTGDPFFNINAPTDLARAEARLEGGDAGRS